MGFGRNFYFPLELMELIKCSQRLIACKTEREGKLALIGSGILVFLQFVLFLGIGLLLFYKYKTINIHPDKIFSKYIIENIPTPILGLIVAAILGEHDVYAI